MQNIPSSAAIFLVIAWHCSEYRLSSSNLSILSTHLSTHQHTHPSIYPSSDSLDFKYFCSLSIIFPRLSIWFTPALPSVRAICFIQSWLCQIALQVATPTHPLGGVKEVVTWLLSNGLTLYNPGRHRPQYLFLYHRTSCFITTTPPLQYHLSSSCDISPRFVFRIYESRSRSTCTCTAVLSSHTRHSPFAIAISWHGAPPPYKVCNEHRRIGFAIFPLLFFSSSVSASAIISFSDYNLGFLLSLSYYLPRMLMYTKFHFISSPSSLVSGFLLSLLSSAVHHVILSLLGSASVFLSVLFLAVLFCYHCYAFVLPFPFFSPLMRTIGLIG